MQRRSNAIVVCAWCGRDVCAREPKGGDGTAYLVFKHKDINRASCEGSYATVAAFGRHVKRRFWRRPWFL